MRSRSRFSAELLQMLRNERDRVVARWRPGIVLFLILLGGMFGWTAWVTYSILTVGAIDHAQQADAIAVFGAAQYAGHPSPVYHSRLDHAVLLYQRGIAPYVITLGGSSDRQYAVSEGDVGRDYLLARGIPGNRILVESQSTDTEQQVAYLTAIAKAQGFHHIVAVSDPTHLFRIAELCRARGLEIYTSPRTSFGNLSTWGRAQRLLHEVLSYTAFKLHLEANYAYGWATGTEED